jgi:hypothetical protein
MYMNTPGRQLYRSRDNRMLGGVLDRRRCDLNRVRLVFVFGVIFGWFAVDRHQDATSSGNRHPPDVVHPDSETPSE